MDKGQAVHEDGHVIPVLKIAPALLILVDDLEEVVVNVLLVDKGDVLGRAVIPFQDLYAVFLDLTALFLNALITVGDALGIEPFPFRIREGILVEPLQLQAQVGDHVFGGMDLKIFIALFAEHLYEALFELRFALVGVRSLCLRFVFRYDRALAGGNYNVVLAQGPTPFCNLFCCFFFERQQLVPVVFVLLLAGLNLGGKAGGEVVAEGVKTLYY